MNTHEYLGNDDCISFSDFPLAVTLMCLGFSLEAIDEDPARSGRCDFLFKKNTSLEDAITQYWRGSLRVDPKLFWGISKEMKSRIRLLV